MHSSPSHDQFYSKGQKFNSFWLPFCDSARTFIQKNLSLDVIR